MNRITQMKGIKILLIIIACMAISSCEDMGIRNQVINLSVDKDENLDDGTIKVHVTVNRDVDIEDIREVVDPIVEQGLDIDIEIPQDNIIVPNESIGAVSIGDSLESVRQLYGEPTWESALDSRTNPWRRAWISRFRWYRSGEVVQASYLDLGLSIWLDNQTSHVKYIGITSPNNARTLDGNGIGSTFANITQEFGEADEIGKSFDDEVMNSYDDSIAFWYGNGLKVTRIIIH